MLDAVETTSLDQANVMVEVRALCDYEPLGLHAGRLGLVPAALLDALRKQNFVDADPSAVAYARQLEQGEA